jgi:hypothetical protein
MSQQPTTDTDVEHYGAVAAACRPLQFQNEIFYSDKKVQYANGFIFLSH